MSHLFTVITLSVELLNVPDLIKLLILSLSMAIKGYKMPLQTKDLWSLNHRDTSKVTVTKLLKEWEKEQTKAKRYAFKRRRGGMDEWGMYCSFLNDTDQTKCFPVHLCHSCKSLVSKCMKTVPMLTYKDSRLLGEIRLKQETGELL